MTISLHVYIYIYIYIRTNPNRPVWYANEYTNISLLHNFDSCAAPLQPLRRTAWSSNDNNNRSLRSQLLPMSISPCPCIATSPAGCPGQNGLPRCPLPLGIVGGGSVIKQSSNQAIKQIKSNQIKPNQSINQSINQAIIINAQLFMYCMMKISDLPMPCKSLWCLWGWPPALVARPWVFFPHNNSHKTATWRVKNPLLFKYET